MLCLPALMLSTQVDWSELAEPEKITIGGNQSPAAEMAVTTVIHSFNPSWKLSTLSFSPIDVARTLVSNSR
jgi:hypothetical protein